MEDAMSAAKKMKSDRKAQKAALTEVVKIQDQPQEKSATNVIDLPGLAQSLTRAKGLSDAEVEAMLAARPESPDASTPEEAAVETAAAETAGSTGDVSEAGPVEKAATPGRDMNKIALFISLAAVILLLGLYMHLNQSLKTLNQQVQDLSAIKTTVSTLDTKIGTMETRVADLETLPAKTRATLMSSILQEMSQKTSYMSTQLDSPEQQDKLMRAKELIQQVQTELSAGN